MGFALLSPVRGAESSMIENLKSQDVAIANNAALQLYKLKWSSIPKLLEIAGDKDQFYGDIATNPFVSPKTLDEFKSPTVGVMALYLIEAILRNDLFFSCSPNLGWREAREKKVSREKAQDRALILYQNWWAEYKNLKVSPTVYPLDRANIEWIDRIKPKN